jgi:ribosome-associated translation inhibitor RaiA
MKLDFRLRGWKRNAQIRQFVERQLDRLPSLGFVSNAQVVLVHERNATPAWTARAHLAIPGPDLRAEARDHTFEAAWRKVMDILNEQVSRRLGRRRHRNEDGRRIRPAGRNT